jgi:hypothetical protein
MLGGSWTRAPRMMAALAVALALGAAGVATAADMPNAPASSASPSAAAPPAAAPPAESPPGAPSSAEAPPSAAPPAAAAPPTVPLDEAPRPATELDGPAPRTQPAAGGSTQSGMAGCAVWTDRCVICQRDSGVVACSNIGIACQPQPLLCLRQETPPEKKQEN